MKLPNHYFVQITLTSLTCTVSARVKNMVLLLTLGISIDRKHDVLLNCIEETAHFPDFCIICLSGA